MSVLQQEPGANGTEILNSLKYVRPGGGFEPNFELTVKVDVNGPNEHPLYSFLKVTIHGDDMVTRKTGSLGTTCHKLRWHLSVTLPNGDRFSQKTS